MSNCTLNILLFTVEIIVAEILFVNSLSKRDNFIKRFVCYVALSLLCGTGLSLLPTEMLENAIFSSVIFFVIFLTSLALLYFCYDVTIINLLFCGIAAYTTQHFAYQATNFVNTLWFGENNPILGLYGGGLVGEIFSFSKETLLWTLVYVMCFYVIYVGAYFLYAKKLVKAGNFEVENRSLLLLAGVGLFLEIVLNSVYVYSGEKNTSSNGITLCFYSCLCCVLLLSMQFELIKTKKLEHELDFTKKLVLQQAENYKINKENIELINIKCHDMRHQIREIGKDRALSEEAIAEIEKTISLYDSNINTGNEILDTILTAKSLLCAKNGISISCIADGKKLRFMSQEDAYSLLGNALDNAIEAVMKIENRDERIIGLNLQTVGNFIALNVYNTFSGQLLFEEGLPKTTKKDSAYHGYGVKSIKYIAEKYDGKVFVSASEDIFSLKILFPMNKDTGV